MTGPAGQPSLPRRWAVMFAACWALALATHTSGLVQPVHCDYSTWLRVAQDWHAGKPLYGEAFDNKNPTVFLTVGLLGWSRPAWSLYLAETLIAALAASILFVAVSRTAPRAAVLAALFLVVWTGTSATFVQGQTTETMALWADVLAVSLTVLAVRNHSYRLAAVAGLFAFYAFSVRIPAVLHLVAYWPIVVFADRRLGRQRMLRLVAVFAAGFLAGLLALYVHGRVDGYWDRFVDVTRYNFQYGAIDRVPLSASLISAAKVVTRLGLANSIMVLLVAAGLAAFGSRTRKLRGEGLWLAVGTTWLCAALLAAFPGGRHYEHYYHPIWAPLSLIAALGCGTLTRNFSRRADRRRFTWIVIGSVVGLAVAQNLYGLGKAWTARRAGDTAEAHIAEATAYLKPKKNDGIPIAMYVWLENAELYWRTAAESGTYPIPQVLPDDRLEVWSRFVIDQKIPLLVVDASFDDRKTGSRAFEELRNMLGSTYVEIRRIGTIRIYAHQQHPFATTPR